MGMSNRHPIDRLVLGAGPPGLGVALADAPEMHFVRSPQRQLLAQPTSEPSDEDALMGQVEALMATLVLGHPGELLGSMARGAIQTIGKRLRARLTLRLSRLLGVREASAVHVAAAIELLHNATLVHDDIQDGDRERREQPTVWVQYGVAQAINVGDLLLMLPFLALAELGDKSALIANDLALAAVATVRGQAEELSLLDRGRLNWTSYVDAARGKTGPLIALSAVATAHLAELEPWRVDVLRQAFSDLGLVFQLQDDVADLFGDKHRRRLGADILDGKVTALVAAELELHPSSHQALLALLRAPKPSKGAAEVRLAQQMFTKGGALNWVLSRITDAAENIRDQVAVLGSHELSHLVEGAIELALCPIQSLLVDRGGSK